MKLKLKIFLVVLSNLLICVSRASEKQDSEKVQKFYEISLQRSWHYAALLIPEGSKAAQKEHARTMVTSAFHYWVMRQEGLIKEMPVYENQIRKTFRNEQLNPNLLSDPLRVFADEGPRYSLVGFPVEIDGYKEMIPKFRKFALDK